MPGTALTAHLADHPDHRARAFKLFLKDHPERQAAGTECDGHARIIPTWDAEERQRRHGTNVPCAPPLALCACGNTMCPPHAIACDRCGRFACLRHRHSGHCPDCGPGRRRQHIAVPKHDPFTKQTTLVSRTYSRAGPPVWERAKPAADPPDTRT